jgi:hypothetical protein
VIVWQAAPGDDSVSTSCLVDLTARHPNLSLLLAGPTIRLSGRHTKVRRDGHRR